MACIDKRVLSTGTSYRVRIRIKGYPYFSITFDNYDSAYEWLKENEKEFIKNPEKYFAIKENKYLKMKQEDKKVDSNVLCPRFYPTVKKKNKS